MRVPHDSVVLVADGAKLLFFRNEGDADYPTLKVLAAEEQADAPDRDVKSGPAGRTGSSPGGAGPTMSEADYHEQAEERFAADAAALLNRRALAGAYQQLVVVASPRTLGALRKHYHAETEKRLVGEVAKDLTGHPVDQIEKIIANA